MFVKGESSVLETVTGPLMFKRLVGTRMEAPITWMSFPRSVCWKKNVLAAVTGLSAFFQSAQKNPSCD